MDANTGVRPAAAAAAAPRPTSAAGSHKCSFRSCHVKGAQTIKCANSKCEKDVHLTCYQVFILNKFGLDPLPQNSVVCTKTCYDKAAKELSGLGSGDDSRKGNWDSDALEGSDRTSMKILLEWWTTEGNYRKYCGKHNNGVKKKEVCGELAKQISEETATKRDAKNVLNKIQHVEKKWREAHDFATSETGAGIQEEDGGDVRFTDIVTRKCPYYYDLLDIMADRASSKPKATSYEVDGQVVDDPLTSGDDASDVDVLNAASVAPSSGTKRTVATSSNSKKKGRRAPTVSLLDDETREILKGNSTMSEKRNAEQERHNRAMEHLKNREVEWKTKNDELEYKMNLLEKYEKMKTEYGWSDKQILSLYPDMKTIVDAQGDE